MTIDTRLPSPRRAADLDTIDIHSVDKYMAEGYPWAEWDLLRREAPVYWYDRPGIEPFWAVRIRSGPFLGLSFPENSSTSCPSPAPKSARCAARCCWRADSPG